MSGKVSEFWIWSGKFGILLKVREIYIILDITEVSCIFLERLNQKLKNMWGMLCSLNKLPSLWSVKYCSKSGKSQNIIFDSDVWQPWVCKTYVGNNYWTNFESGKVAQRSRNGVVTRLAISYLKGVVNLLYINLIIFSWPFSSETVQLYGLWVVANTLPFARFRF